MEFRIQQEATRRSAEWWQWSVWVDGSESALDQIDYVEYILHPTFAKPIQQVRNRRTKFRLSTSGWGEFKIHIHIYQRDGSVQKLDHWLRFEGSAQPGGLAIPAKSIEGARCFVSYSLADAGLVETVSNLLAKSGIQFVGADDYEPNISIDEALRRLLTGVDYGLIIFTDVRISPWVTAEADALIRNDIPTLFVRIDPQTELPGEFARCPSVQIGDHVMHPRLPCASVNG